MPTLQIDIEARLASFQDSLDKIGRQGEQMAGRLNKAFGVVKGSLAAVGASLTVGAFASFVKSGIDAADGLNKLSQKVGVTVESLSALQYAAKLSDLSNEELGSSLAKLAKSASAATAGTGDAADAFRAIGVAVKDASGNLRGTEDILLDIADRFSKMQDSAGKTAIAMRLFGKSGAELIPFLNQGKAGLEALRKEAERLGIIISGETARAAEEFNDNMTRLAASSEKTKIALVEGLLPALLRVSERMAEAARNGEGFLGLLKSLGELSPFTDLQRASKELVELVDEQLSIEKELGRRTGKAGSEEVAALNARLDATKTRVGEVQKLLGVLRGETDAFGDPKKAEAAKVKAPDLSGQADALAAARAKIENEIKRVNNAVKDQEADTGGALQIMQTMLSQNLISFETYYDKRRQLAEQSLNDTVASAQAEIASLRRLRDILPKGSERLGVDARIEDAQGKIEDAQRKFAQTTVQTFFESKKAADDYAKSLTDIEVQIKEIQGDTVGAALGRFGQQTRDLQLQAQAKGDTGTLERVAALRDQVGAQAKINGLLQQAQIINDQLANSEARINIDRQAGSAGELTALQRLSNARQAALPQLRDIAERYREIATSLGNPVAIQQAENFKRQVDELAASADTLGNKFREIGESAFAQFFTDVVEGTKSVKDAFASMGRSIISEINKLVAQDIAKRIFGSVGGGSSGGAGGGFLNTALSFVGSLFGGFKAEGGPVMPGKGYIVGERGPEWFMPKTAGSIVPAGAGGTVIHYSPTFVIRGDQNTPQSRSQLASDALRGLEYGRRNL